MYNLGRCLEYGKGIDQNVYRPAKYYRLSGKEGSNAGRTILEFGVQQPENLRRNYTNSLQITVIRKEKSITAAVFACLVNRKAQIALATQFRIHFAAAFLTIQIRWTTMTVDCFIYLADSENQKRFPSSRFGWILNGLRMNLDVVTLSSNSKGGLIAVNAHGVQLIVREIEILNIRSLLNFSRTFQRFEMAKQGL
jgi:hypothetical protein